MRLLRAVPEVASIAGVVIALSPVLTMVRLPRWLRALLSLIAFILEGIPLSCELWSKQHMSTPATTLGAQLLQAETPVVVSPVDAFLTEAESSGSEAELAAAAVKLLAAEATAGIPGLVALKTITAHWLHGRIDGWMARHNLAPVAAAAPAKAA